MDWVFISAAVLSAWAVLTVVGNERQRTLDATAAGTAAGPTPVAPPDTPAHA